MLKIKKTTKKILNSMFFIALGFGCSSGDLTSDGIHANEKMSLYRDTVWVKNREYELSLKLPSYLFKKEVHVDKKNNVPRCVSMDINGLGYKEMGGVCSLKRQFSEQDSILHLSLRPYDMLRKQISLDFYRSMYGNSPEHSEVNEGSFMMEKIGSEIFFIKQNSNQNLIGIFMGGFIDDSTYLGYSFSAINCHDPVINKSNVIEWMKSLEWKKI